MRDEKRSAIAGLVGLCLLVGTGLFTGTASADPGVEREIVDVTRRLELAPQDATLLIRRADLRRRVERFDEALADLALAEATADDTSRVYLVRARIHVDRGEESRALRLLEAALPSMRSGEQAEAYAVIARIHEEDGHVIEAVDAYDASLALRDDVALYLSRGRLLVYAGRFDDAVSGYEAGVQALAGAAILRAELVELHLALGAPERALIHADALVDAARAKARFRVMRARVYEAEGRTALARSEREAALVDAERVLARRNSALARLERARALLALGREAEALDDLRRVVRRAPALSEARSLLHRVETGGAR
jgi:tetratricopeptide (TPR) repeat protein